MTTYTDEISIYNTDAIQDGIDDAHDAYKSVITEVGSTGVKVHPSGQSGSGIVDYTLVDANGTHVYKGGDDVAMFGSTARIGSLGSKHLGLSSRGMFISSASTDEAMDHDSTFYIDALGQYEEKHIYDPPENPGMHFGEVLKFGNLYIDPVGMYFDKFDTSGGTVVRKRPFAVEQDKVRLGNNGTSHVDIDYQSLKLIDKEGNAYFHVSDLRNAQDYVEITERFEGDGTTKYFTVGMLADGIGTTSATVNGTAATVQSVSGRGVTLSTAPPNGSEVCITYRTSSYEAKAFTFGWRKSPVKYGAASFAEGYAVEASGMLSHAEGMATTASGQYSHAEGQSSTASNLGSHAEGASTASGRWSHAQNFNTIAASSYQTTIGKYNDNQSTNAFEIGNGTSNDARSNAFAVGWNGDVECGDVNGVEISDSGWNTLTLASGWVAYETAQAPKYRKIGSLVELCGAVKPTAATTLGDSAVAFGTLPAGYRPNGNRHQLCQASGTRSWLLTVYPNGDAGAARLRAQNSTSYQTAATTEWLTFHIMYFVD